MVERCRERGYEPTLHHHTGTFLEAVWEIERALDVSDIGLCLDTGHLLVGGGDPVKGMEAWGDRINHVHLKDARRDVIDRISAEGASVEAIWRRRAFCRLGEGDVDVERVLDHVKENGYSGWLVVEQDTMPDPAWPLERAAADQEASSIIAEAKAEAERFGAESRAAITAQIARRGKQAEQKIAQAEAQAVADVRAAAADAAIAAAEKLIAARLDDNRAAELVKRALGEIPSKLN